MKVFYPISEKFSNFINNDAPDQSGWTATQSMLGLFSLMMLGLTFVTVPVFEGGAADKQHELYSKSQGKDNAVSYAGQSILNSLQHKINFETKKRVFVQGYVDAHRFVEHLSGIREVRFAQLPVVPVRSRAGVYQSL